MKLKFNKLKITYAVRNLNIVKKISENFESKLKFITETNSSYFSNAKLLNKYIIDMITCLCINKKSSVGKLFGNITLK